MNHNEARLRRLRAAGLWMAAALSLVLLYFSKLLGPAAQLCTMLFFVASVISGLLGLRSLLLLVLRRRGGPLRIPVLDRLFLVIGALAFSLLLIEAWLWVADSLELGSSVGQQMPTEWQRVAAEVPGAKSAHRWHGHLFVYDENGMRRTSEIPAKNPAVCRIAVFGDSLTYGYGVAEESTYVRRLQAMLEEDFEVEVLNLGVSGHSSEDIARAVARFAPILEADLIVYGICLNDFLPTGVREYRTPPFPVIPTKVKVFAASRTRLGLRLRNSYQNLLINLGLEHDFYDDILADFSSYSSRFAEDLQTISEIVADLGLPPVTAMVLEQYPEAGGKGHEITLLAEKSARAAGMAVVGIDEYITDYDGQRMGVSEWEGHPNEAAHQLFAELMHGNLRDHPVLQRYRCEHDALPDSAEAR